MRKISEVAEEIKVVWPNVHPWAEPYLDAMLDLENVTDYYGDDPADHVIAYFLSNARYWRGPDAKRIKAELKDMLEA